MIFDTETYSPLWTGDFLLAPVETLDARGALPRFQTHATLGCIRGRDALWRLEPGLGADFEVSHTLLLHCGFQLTFPNAQDYQVLHLAPGVLIGRLPPRAKPELFSPEQSTEREEDFAFLKLGDIDLGLYTQFCESDCRFVMAAVEGGREACKAKLQALSPAVAEKLNNHWQTQLKMRESWCAALPESYYAENPGLGLERLQSLIEAPSGIFNGPWIRDPVELTPCMSVALAGQVIPAIALTQPALAADLLNTLLSLPKLPTGSWAASYAPDSGADPDRGPAQPHIASFLAALPSACLKTLDRAAWLPALKAQVESFLATDQTAALPQWPQADAAFTPEVTDPTSLIQYDLAALLILEIEACQKLSDDLTLMEAQRQKLQQVILQNFWSEKDKRFLDKTTDGTFTRRVTAATLIPLLWRLLDKNQSQALRQCLQSGDELRAPEGIRQWQPKIDDPVPPPLRLGTQHLFLPLLDKLPGEIAALLSADWHRLMEADAELAHPATAALWIRLIPYASRVNHHLERYPSWVRRLEKHRQTLVAVAAVILLLVPSTFGIYFALRSDYNLSDELMESGHAETLVTMGNLVQAEEVYTRLLTHARNQARHPQYYLKRGNLLFIQEKYDAALPDYKQAVDLDAVGNLYQARWNLGQTYARLGETDRAITILREFMAEYGEEIPAYSLRAENAISLWQK